MKKFAKDLITSRFGIVLAALNICYFASRNFISYEFSHGSGKACWFSNQYNLLGLKTQYAEIMFSANSPAILLSFIPANLIKMIFPPLCGFEQAKIHIVLLGIFITFQWLFIAWAAKTIAQAARPNQN
ncbi:MAG: hypothetical protein H0U50_11785 [Pyrinomonadaceae bacterium]|nr:hypothetical protein [Pyrinomonadaceae bacterium]